MNIDMSIAKDMFDENMLGYFESMTNEEIEAFMGRRLMELGKLERKVTVKSPLTGKMISANIIEDKGKYNKVMKMYYTAVQAMINRKSCRKNYVRFAA